MMNKRAGYRGTSPQIQAAHDKASYDYMYERPKDRQEAVDTLYRAHREEMLQQEELAAADQTEGGQRMREFFTVVRHCIFEWIVSTVARPRDRMGLIAADRPIKRLLCASVFTKHLIPLLGTVVYAEIASSVLKYEEEEISLGQMANYSETELRDALRIAEMERRLTVRIDAPYCERKAA